MNLLRNILLVASILLNLYSVNAQKNQQLIIRTQAVEGLTGQAIEDVKVIVRNAETGDSILEANTFLGSIGYDTYTVLAMFVDFSLPKIPHRYLIEGIAEGYDTVYRDLNIDKIGAREVEKRLPNLVFYKKSHTLKEVSVTASKVKFYVKGDTLVYNADAFKLAEGSMLDALIKQLPGVELKDGGQIFVNGKFVESLLLNGKDFFQGDKQIMLNNLGAYTVKDIAVYDKQGKLSEFAGTDMGDSQYVMDVRLKKEYLSGFIGNVGAGAGTAQRYLGRLFGLWFTNRSRVGLVGNINNLNDSRTPGQNDTWTSTQPAGDFRTKMAGLDYNISSDGGSPWQFFGNTMLTHTRNNDISSKYVTDFLPAGDIYETRFANALSHNLNVTSNNNLNFTIGNNVGMNVAQRFDYRKNDSESDDLSGLFQEETKNLNDRLLHQIYSGGVTSFKDITINTTLNQMLQKGSLINAGATISSMFKIAHTPDILTLTADGNYSDYRQKNFNLYGINYNLEATKDEIYQYIHNKPDRDWNISLAPKYMYKFSYYGRWIAELKYRHAANTKDSYLYDLDLQQENGIFGQLPSGYQSSLNYDQTQLSNESSDAVSFQFNLLNSVQYRNNRQIQFQLIPNISYVRRKLHYIQGDFDGVARTNNLNIEFYYSHFSFWTSNNFFRLTFTRNIKEAPLHRMLDFIDTRNPLNFYTGNPDLKNMAINTLTFNWTKNLGSKARHNWNNFLGLQYVLVENALTGGYSFDSDSGLRIYKMFNVAGNYSLKLWDTFYKAFGSKDQFDISITPSVNYIKESDMMATNGVNFKKSSVNNLLLGETFNLTWKIGNQQIGLNSNLTWRNTKGEDAGFRDFTSLNAQYGVSAQLSLPYNFSLSTDLNLYSRRGYSESYLNTTDVVRSNIHLK